MTSTRVVTFPFASLTQILQGDVVLARRFYQNMCVCMAARYLRIVFQKTGAYVNTDDEDAQNPFLNSPSSPYGVSFSPDTLTVLAKLKIPESEALIEVPCKSKGKVIFNESIYIRLIKIVLTITRLEKVICLSAMD